jgi:thiamine pyrophosphokinase
MKRCIIIGNGKPPRKNIIEYIQKEGHSTIICADGGANSARKLGIIPDFIIGDLDSISAKTLKHYKNISKIIGIKRQTDTDIEKCLKFSISKGIKEAVLTGVTGDRLDHTFCNLGIVLKFFNKIGIKIIAEKSLLTAYSKNVRVKTLPGEIFSIYGFDEKTRITSKGLKYPLNKVSLPFGKKESTSNVALSNLVNLKITGGIIFVIRDFNTVKKNGFF